MLHKSGQFGQRIITKAVCLEECNRSFIFVKTSETRSIVLKIGWFKKYLNCYHSHTKFPNWDKEKFFQCVMYLLKSVLKCFEFLLQKIQTLLVIKLKKTHFEKILN